MRIVTRLLELLLIVGSFVYTSMISYKLLQAEKRVSYLEGRASMYEVVPESPNRLPKW